jgi:FHS family L-fucose permease-like MFS transporter
MNRSFRMVGLVFLIFFALSLFSNILGPIIPDIIDSFHVSMTAAACLPFSFFIAYGVMSIPGGMLVDRLTEKPVIAAAFLLSLAGSLAFAITPVYPVAVVSLFVIGAGMAVLQVAINPLLRTAGGEEHFAFNSALAQFIFGVASFLSPYLYSSLTHALRLPASQRGPLTALLAKITPAALPWVSLYWVFAVINLAMLAVVFLTRFPAVQRTEEESVGSRESYRKVMAQPVVWRYFLCIFAYVGSEQGTADWISKFLFDYHGLDPHTAGASTVAWFWGLFTVGCFIGTFLLKLYDSRTVLAGICVGALASLTVALFGSATASVIAFPLVGLFASVMWPILLSLALNSVAEHHGSVAGVLCSAIMGGAVLPLIIGRIGDKTGLRAGMTLLYLSFLIVMSAAFWAKPLIQNSTLQRRQTS